MVALPDEVRVVLPATTFAVELSGVGVVGMKGASESR